MAQDERREAEALEWAEGTVGDGGPTNDSEQIAPHQSGGEMNGGRHEESRASDQSAA